MACIICDAGSSVRTRIEFLPSRKSMEVSMCDGCMRDVAATKSVNVVRLDR